MKHHGWLDVLIAIGWGVVFFLTAFGLFLGYEIAKGGLT
jgi:hypothetical protein